MALETRPCERCGKLATRYRKPGEVWPFWTCSRSCAAYLRHTRGALASTSRPNRFRGQRESRPCARCGQPTQVRYVTEQNQAGPWYCSRDCGRPTSETAHPRTGREIPCATCGTPVYWTPGRRRGRAVVYCSSACNYQAHRLERIERACATCGTLMSLLPCHRAKRYCSRACSTAGRYTRHLERMHNGRPARYDGLGYVLVWEPDHPNAKKGGWILEHRLVMSQELGRPLMPHEEIHHKNADRADNRKENLEVLSRAEHRTETALQRRQAKADLLAEVEQLRAERAARDQRLAALEAQLAALNGAADAESSPD